MAYPTQNLQHAVFCPKWRKDWLTLDCVAKKCEALIRDICQQKGIEIVAIAIQPDHIHLMFYLPNNMSLSKAMQLIKWFSSFYIRAEFSYFQQFKAFWATHYWAKSVGGGRKTQEKYVEAQMRKENMQRISSELQNPYYHS